MQVKTIKLTGEETKIEFDSAHAFVEINNLSSSEILISTRPGIVRGGNDVIILNGKTIVTIGETSSCRIKTIYASGNGEIQLIGKNFAEHCFKLPAYGDSSDVKPVLDFLPHPEDIYAYWDWEHGVENTTWTDMINGSVIKCENGNNFVMQNSSISLNKDGCDAIIPVKDISMFTLYIVIDSPWDYSRYHILQSMDGEYFFHNRTSNGYKYVQISGKRDFRLMEFNSSTNYHQVGYALSSSPSGTITSSCFDTSSHAKANNPLFITDFGLYSANVKIKAILLSSDVTNVDGAFENIKVLYNKYWETI